MDNIVQILAEIITDFGRSVTELARHFIETQSFGEKYSIAHQLAIPLVFIFFFLVYLLDKYDAFWEKVLYTIYFILGIEVLVFIAVLITTLAQS